VVTARQREKIFLANIGLSRLSFKWHSAASRIAAVFQRIPQAHGEPPIGELTAASNLPQ